MNVFERFQHGQLTSTGTILEKKNIMVCGFKPLGVGLVFFMFFGLCLFAAGVTFSVFLQPISLVEQIRSYNEVVEVCTSEEKQERNSKSLRFTQLEMEGDASTKFCSFPLSDQHF